MDREIKRQKEKEIEKMRKAMEKVDSVKDEIEWYNIWYERN